MDQHGNSADTATDLQISPYFFEPTRVRAELHPRGDEDWFRVNLQKGKWYWFDVREIDFVGAPTVELISNGNTVVELDKEFDTFHFRADRTGEYFIRVSVEVSPRTKYYLSVGRFEGPNVVARAITYQDRQTNLFNRKEFFWEDGGVFGTDRAPAMQFFYQAGTVPYSLASSGEVFASGNFYEIDKNTASKLVPTLEGFEGPAEQIPFYARLNWGDGHQKWTRSTIMALPNFSSALGKRWIKGGTISYSFDNILPSYYDSDEYSDFRPLVEEQKNAFRKAFDAWGKYLNIGFRESSSGLGFIRIGNRHLHEPYQAFQRFNPWFRMEFNTTESDIFVSNKLPHMQNLREGSLGFYQILQSIGMAIGFNPANAVDTFLPEEYRNSMYTVMSNNNHPKFGDVYPSTPGLFDILQAQSNYRTGRVNGKMTYTFSASGQWRGAIMSSSGKEVVSAAGHNQRATIRLETHEFSFIGSKNHHQHFWVNAADSRDNPLFQTYLESAIGGNRADRLVGSKERNQLFGGPGGDILIGRQGNDFLNGGRGHDRYHWQLGDGSDVIRERNGHGNDLVQIQSEWGLKEFKSDLSFRKMGNDLVINLGFENGNANQGKLTIRDMGSPKSRIESLRVLGKSNEVIANRVSLVSVWTSLMQSGASSEQSFALSSNSDSYGLRVVPA